jgi:ATP synthase protein I
MEDRPEQNNKKGQSFKEFKDASLLATVSSIGISMVLATFMGFGAGYWLDKQLGTSPWLLIIGLLIGIVAGFKNIFVIIDRVEKEQKKNESNSSEPKK